MGYSSWNKPPDFTPPKPSTPSSSASTNSAPVAKWSPALAAAGLILVVFSPLYDTTSLNLGGALSFAAAFRANEERCGGAQAAAYFAFVLFLILATLAVIAKFSAGPGR